VFYLFVTLRFPNYPISAEAYVSLLWHWQFCGITAFGNAVKSFVMYLI